MLIFLLVKIPLIEARIPTKEKSRGPSILKFYNISHFTYAGTFFSGIKRLEVANLKKVMYPPLNFIVEQVENKSLSLVEYINVLTWKMNSENKDITGYRLYITDPNGEKELLSVFYSPVFTYIHRGIEKDYTYCLAAVDKERRESPLAYASQTFR